ncbi:MAG: hypothetical protein SGBAC_012162 [Bacillariaceae sp.]
MSKRTSHKGANKAPDREPKIVDHVADGDDEEISEDEAFNSDDERMYGHLFRCANEDEETDSSGGDGEDDGGDDGQYMLELLDKLGNSTKSEESKSLSHMGKLTLDNLMEGLNDTQGYNELRKSLKKEQRTILAPIDKKHTDREQRNVAYTEQVKNLSSWTEVIQENRQAETLDFKPKTRVEATKDSLATVFEPKSEFENDLQNALEQAGQEDEDAILRKEESALQDDLGSNRLSIDEYKKRRSQLAQIRALMFYHEQKRHHIKKIKSKKYRRIRKNQRQRQQDSMLEAAMQEDKNLASEMKQKEEVSRIQERMTLAHKNTSKWAKRLLKRGKNVDVETRKALSAQLKRGDDLRRKIIDNEEQCASDGASDEEDLLKSTQDILADVKANNSEGNERHRLFKLSFMQKGIQKQRDLAKKEARKLLTELKSNEIDERKDMTAATNVKASAERTVASSQELQQHLATGELMAKSREFGVSKSLVSSGPINVLHDMELGIQESSPIKTRSRDANESGLGITKENSGRKCIEKKMGENPWIGLEEFSGIASSNSKRNKDRSTSKAKNHTVLNLDAVADILNDTKTAERLSSKTETSEVTKQAKIASLNQDELVKRAFATTAMEEVTAEFEQETEDTAGLKSKTNGDPETSSGWGSWAGMGAPPLRQARADRKTLALQKESNSNRKRSANGKHDVIINKKRLKKASDVFMLGEVPHPFSSREEYEQVMSGGIGREWNVASAYRNMTRPEILTRPGKSIRPISKSAKVKRAAAKF